MTQLLRQSQNPPTGREQGHREVVSHRLLTAMSLLVRNDAVVSGDTKDILQEVARLGAMTLDVQRVSVWFFDQGRTLIYCANLYDAAMGSHVNGTRLAAGDYPAYFAEINRGRVVDAHDALRDPRTREFANHYLVPLGITSMLDVPIKVRRMCVGVLCCEHTGPLRKWHQEERQFALFGSSLLSLAFEVRMRLGELQVQDLLDWK